MELHLDLADLGALVAVEPAIKSIVEHILEQVAATFTTTAPKAILIHQTDSTLVISHHHQMDSVQHLLWAHLHQMDFSQDYLVAAMAAVAAIAVSCLVADNSSSLSFVY